MRSRTVQAVITLSHAAAVPQRPFELALEAECRLESRNWKLVF